MYADKLDGNITNEFFEDKSREQKNEQSNIFRQIDQHKNTNYSYINEWIALLELAQNAHSLFAQQDAVEKLRLLNFVTSDPIWDGKNLIPTLKQLFDMIVSSKIAIKSRITPDMSKSEIFANSGSPGRIRTSDQAVNSRLLYH